MNTFKRTTLMITLLVLVGSLATQATAADKLDKVKCAFLLNFTKYVVWPGGSGDFVIGVVGKDPFDGVLDKIVGGKKAGDRPIKTTYLAVDASADELKKCSILFINTDVKPVLEKIGNAPILTVGDTADFAKNKGMVGLIATNKINLEINKSQADAAKLKINAKLLQMAKIVD
ncbi:MAG: YfiR family protein [Phycisphaeraceae bacterium JB051]